ncbi:pseudaminic acid synthase [Candidatus Pelagibacter sp.]|nr:pseudaminic acid synthase [Candidatus Pelagibacter sp.]
MLKIKKRIISKNHKPFIIAEMSGNHNGSLSKALKIVDLAAEAGVDAIKLQTFTAETITMKGSRKEFFIKDKKNIWKNNSLYDLYKKAETPWEWHKKIFDRAKNKKLIYFSSPFDETAVDFLEKLNVPMYKIASFESNHFPLLKKIAKTGKPVIMSTGLATLDEIKDSVEHLRKNGCKQLALLKCTSSYPANPTDLNLISIQKLKKIFKCEVGFSDHSLGIGASITAIAYGATIIEKHFTLKKDVGLDGFFSSEVKEMKRMREESIISWLSKGKIFFGPSKSEKIFKKYRRSIYCLKNIKKGEVFSPLNVKVIRPNLGLHPKYYPSLIGKKSKKNIKPGEPIKKNYF